MNLYIRLLNGKPVDHPVFEYNLKDAYPNIDLDNLPEDWARFVRVSQPKLGPYEKAECQYEWEGDVVKDVWYIHEMSDVEKSQKIAQVKKNYIEDGGFENWVFDEEKCCHVPPVPYPDDGKAYEWVQNANKWVEIDDTPITLDIPPYPEDGNIYLLNEETNKWDLKTDDIP